jgi:hypothetical protein
MKTFGGPDILLHAPKAWTPECYMNIFGIKLGGCLALRIVSQRTAASYVMFSFGSGKVTFNSCFP